MTGPSTRRAVYGVLGLVCATGLVMNFISSLTADEPRSLGTRMLRFFSYFTIESNILVLAVAVVLAAGALRGGGFAVLYLDALLGITVTGIVFAAVLAPDDNDIGLASVLLHYVSPPLALLAWFLLGPSHGRTRRIIGLALLWPLAYVSWTLVHGAITDWYPYGFIDADDLGYGPMLRNLVFVMVLALALCAAFIAVDRRRPQR